MVRTLPHGTTPFLSFFLPPVSIFAKGINKSSLNAFQFLKIKKYSITSSKSSKKLCHTTNPPTALPVGVSRVRPRISDITPLTCTIFDPGFQALFSPDIRLTGFHAIFHLGLFQLDFFKSAQTGPNRCQSVTLSTFSEQGHKSAHERPHGVRRPGLPPRIYAPITYP